MAGNATTSFDLLGKRWSALIVQELIAGPLRFRQLLNHLSRINDKVLSQRLKELEGANILKRQVFRRSADPGGVLAQRKGRGLADVIPGDGALGHHVERQEWAQQWQERRAGAGC